MNLIDLKPVILVVASNGYQPHEYQIPYNYLQQQGFKVVTASNKNGQAEGSDNSITSVDILVQDIKIEDYSGIFFIGGAGALEHLDNQISYDLINRAHDLGIPFGAICISPRILAKSGALDMRRATGWNEDGKLPAIFASYNVTYEPVPVVVDRNVVTAEGPKAAEAFAKAIGRVILDK